MAAGYLQFTQLTYQVKEDGTWLTNKPLVERIGGVDGEVSVRVAFSSSKNNKGSKDIDFVVPTQILRWNNGESGNKEVNLAILQDTIEEDDEVFNLSLSKITAASYGERKKCNIIISDDDSLINSNSIVIQPKITLLNDYPTISPDKQGDICISTFTNKEFVYLGVNTNNNLSWKKISDSAVFSENNPENNIYDFKGQIWINKTNNDIWIRGNNSWISLTNNSASVNNMDLSSINSKISTLENEARLYNGLVNAVKTKVEGLAVRIDLELIYEQGKTYNSGITKMTDWKSVQSALINCNDDIFQFQQTGFYELEMNLSYQAAGIGKLGFRMLNNVGNTCGRSHIIRTIQGDNQSNVKFLFAIRQGETALELQIVNDIAITFQYVNSLQNIDFPAVQLSIRQINGYDSPSYPIPSIPNNVTEQSPLG